MLQSASHSAVTMTQMEMLLLFLICHAPTDAAMFRDYITHHKNHTIAIFHPNVTSVPARAFMAFPWVEVSGM